MKKSILIILSYLIGSVLLTSTISYGYYNVNNIQKKVKLENIISKYFEKKENKYLKKGIYKKEIYKRILLKIEKINNKIDKIILSKKISEKTKKTLLNIKTILKVKENEYRFKYQQTTNKIIGKAKIITSFTDKYIIGNKEKRKIKGIYYIHNDFYFDNINKNFLLNTNLDVKEKNIIIYSNQKPIITEYSYKNNLIKIIGKDGNIKIITNNKRLKEKINNFMKNKNMYDLIYSVLNKKSGNEIKIKELYNTIQEEKNIKKILDSNNKINENKLCQLLNNTLKINNYKCISEIEKENIQVFIGKNNTYNFILPKLKIIIKLNYHNGKLTETNINYGNKNLLTINKNGISSNFEIVNYPFSINTNIKNNFGTIKIRFGNAIANIKITNKYAILELFGNNINNNLKIILKYKDEYSLQAFINNNNEHIKINGKYYPESKKIVILVISQLGIWKRMQMLSIQQINTFNYNLKYYGDLNYENYRRKISVNSNIKIKFIK